MRRNRTPRRRTPSRSRKTSRKKGIVLIPALLLLVAICIALFRLQQKQSSLKGEQVEGIVRQLDGTLQTFHIQDKWRTRIGSTVSVKIPSITLLDDLLPAIQRELASADAEIVQVTPDESSTQTVLSIGRKDRIFLQYVFAVDPSILITHARAAIVIDDFGYAYNDVVQEFIFFPGSVTLSILPGLAESERIAQKAVEADKQILIHMPMEPLYERYRMDEYILLADQDPAAIRSRIRRAFSAFPDAVGMNNHQGSKFTSMAGPIEIALDEIKKHDKLFIDSKTSSTSLAYRTARRLGLKSAENDLFIDANDDEAFISRQMKLVVKTALQRGKVIAIGHVRPKTLAGVYKALDDFRQADVEMVFVSELVK